MSTEKKFLKECDFLNSHNEKEITDFYDNRYINVYVGEWPVQKKQRIFDLIRELNLPIFGEALDFGCGNGEITGILKKGLPKWNIYGVDISPVAIKNAKSLHPDCCFFLKTDTGFSIKRFDFLFTHHVLEHVSRIEKTWQEINNYLKEKSSILHILPCGNAGSFEYKICLLHKNGINNKENKFFFEDISHLRRLDTKQMNYYANQYRFCLKTDYYSNQFYGAIDWISLESPGFILQMTSIKNAKNMISALKLTLFRIIFLLVKLMRIPANRIDYKNKKMKSNKYYFLFLLFYPFSKLTNIYLRHMSNAEWEKKKYKKNGSEMFLFFKRNVLNKI